MDGNLVSPIVTPSSPTGSGTQLPPGAYPAENAPSKGTPLPPALSSFEAFRASAQDISPGANTAVLTALETGLFIEATTLLASVTLAVRDAQSQVQWITLKADFHNQLVKTALNVLRVHKVDVPLSVVKTSLFSFLLSILNGRPQDTFFAKKDLVAKGNRANRERKRLSRKRARAAKRERTREERKLTNPSVARSTGDGAAALVVGSSRICSVCKQKFTSRKTLSKHKCTGAVRKEKKAVEPLPAVTAKVVAKRARRRKARLLKRKRAAGKPEAPSDSDDKKLASQSGVTVTSQNSASQLGKSSNVEEETDGTISQGETRVRPMCEECEKHVSTGIKRTPGGGEYPKCHLCRLNVYGSYRFGYEDYDD